MSINGTTLTPVDAARNYVGAGLSVLPISADGSKAPRWNVLPKQNTKPTWKPFQERCATSDEIASMFSGRGGVGIIGGSVSGNLVILDIDDGSLVQPFIDMVEAVSPGLLDKLPRVQTPRDGGGVHLYLRASSSRPTEKLAMSEPRPQFTDGGQPLINPKTKEHEHKPETLIEIKAEGGYCAAPGTPGYCHRTGREYRHVAGPPITQTPIVTDDEYDALVSVACTFDRSDNAEPIDQPSTNRMPGKLSPGDDYNQQATVQTVVDMLVSNGWAVCYSSGEVVSLRRPGKSSGGISGNVGHRSKAGVLLFCCFSSNASPFEGAQGRSLCTSYSPFATFATLYHGGDFSAAAKDLAAQGYGDQMPRRQFDEPPPGVDVDYDPAATTQPVFDEDTGQFRHDGNGKPQDDKPACEIVSARSLMDEHARLREPIVEGLLRRGEVMNIIAAAKRGKSWLSYGFALSVTTGDVWLGQFQCKRGKVLLIDNELHPETLASRINTVANAMFVKPAEYDDSLDVLSLRGRLLDLSGIAQVLRDVAPLTYDVVLLDAFYRALTPGTSENDNAGIAGLYNRIDQLAATLDCCWVNIHHASKGQQGQKSVVDVGAGAGSQSRAADTHLILRDHEEPDAVVLEAAVRSFAPVEPLGLKWAFPLWQPEATIDTDKILGRLNPAERRQQEKDREGCKIIREYIREHGPSTASKIVKNASLGRDRAQRLLNTMYEEGELDAREINARGNETKEFSLRGPSSPTT